jgi:hypothetical protein
VEVLLTKKISRKTFCILEASFGRLLLFIT